MTLLIWLYIIHNVAVSDRNLVKHNAAFSNFTNKIFFDSNALFDYMVYYWQYAISNHGKTWVFVSNFR